MSNLVEQRACLKFCLKNEISCANALKMLQKAYGDSCMSKTQAYEWYKTFKEGREIIENLPHDRRPSRGTNSPFLQEGQTVNAQYYLGVLQRLRENIRRKRPELWQNNSWFLHHDNAPAHTSRLVLDYLTKNNVNIIPQAPYSPDMAPCDFFLFPRLKLPLRGKRFESIEFIKENSLRELKAIPLSAYEKCFEDWKKRWQMCIASDGDYFEGDKINIKE